jgi:beta-glucosidase-like glycosyl hydrolase
VVMTDDLWGTALRSYVLDGADVHPVHYPDSAFGRLVEEAVRAGNDVLMITYPRKVPLMIAVIERLAERDSRVREHVDAAARRIILCKRRLKLL